MHALKRLLDRSLLAQALVVFPLCVGAVALFRPDAHPVGWVVQAALYTAVAFTVLGLQRRRVSGSVGIGPASLADLDRRIRRREVPDDPGERVTMLRLVDEHLARLGRSGRWLWAWLVFMGLTVVGALVLGAATGSWGLPASFTVLVSAFCVWAVWMRRRSLERLRFMRSTLRDAVERAA
ncbi:hypothetical protein [Streptomyces sp. NPDC002564]|uniref:hypothetical protein n=1 Tax=Streptomyces sp. NPDC002564 TaxID=3364649 RepID=UPI0036AA20CD